MDNRQCRRKRKRPLYILLVLACVIFSVLLISNPRAEHFKAAPAETTEPAAPISPAPEATTVPLPAPGTLLESGADINLNYYKKLDYTGTPSDLTSSSFVLGKERPATNGKTGQDYPGILTVNFGEYTVIKTALLYYPEDRYEVYMGSAEDLKIEPGYTFDIVLENPDAAELRAKEIIVSSFVF